MIARVRRPPSPGYVVKATAMFVDVYLQQNGVMGAYSTAIVFDTAKQAEEEAQAWRILNYQVTPR